MVENAPDTDALVELAAAGDGSAADRLFERHRRRLRKMISVRLNPLVFARVDPSDIVQESLAEASQRLAKYASQKPLPFYPWLRQIALEKIIQTHRAHLHRKRRSVIKEDPLYSQLPAHSTRALAQKLLAAGTNPSQKILREERRARVRAALDELGEGDREILVLRYLEGLSTEELTAVLGISKEAAKSRVRRALAHFARLVQDEAEP